MIGLDYEPVYVFRIDGDSLSLPSEARDFIARFDDDQPVYPFAFELEGL